MDGLTGLAHGFVFVFFQFTEVGTHNRLSKYGIYHDDGSEAVVVARLGKPIPTVSENEFSSSVCSSSLRIFSSKNNGSQPFVSSNAYGHY